MTETQTADPVTHSLEITEDEPSESKADEQPTATTEPEKVQEDEPAVTLTLEVTDEEPEPTPTPEATDKEPEPTPTPTDPPPATDDEPDEEADSTSTDEEKEAEKWVDDMPSGELVFTPYGLMIKYFAEKIPIYIYVPGMLKDDYSDTWIKPEDTGEAPTYPLFQRQSETFPSQLTITEVSFEDLGISEILLEDYARDVIYTNAAILPDFDVINAITHDITDDMTVALLTYSSEKGQRMYQRLIYIHENGYIFNMTISYQPAVDDITETVEYIFSSITLIAES